jgi:glutathione S-transferase
MKLYDSRRAPNPRRVRWFMAEKGIDDVEIVDVDLLAGDHREPDYLSRAGLPHVPSLTVDTGETITESIAICRYLEAVVALPNMFGLDPWETALIEMWTRRAEMLAATPLMMAVRHGHPALAVLENQSPEIASRNRHDAEKALKIFDARLGESEWLGADRITMADGVLFIAIDFARMIRFQVPEDLVNVTRWLSVMRNRPSARAGV